jgi:antitoxin component of RelBE/YafQ-DinJ toxin-antitoxin module
MVERDSRISIMLSEEEKESIESAADSIGVTTAGYVRMLVLQASSDRLPLEAGGGGGK